MEGRYIQDKIEEAFYKASPSLLIRNENHIKIYLPRIAIQKLIEYFNTLVIHYFDNKGIIKYRGIQVV